MKRLNCFHVLLLLGILAWSLGLTAHKAKALTVVELLKPADSTKVTTALPTFQWRATKGSGEVTTRFHIKLADNPGLVNPMWEDSTISGTDSTKVYPSIAPLIAWQTYYWTMRVEVKKAGVTYWQEEFAKTSTFFFTTAVVIEIPTNLPTIQQGIVWAAEGDTVRVKQGIYYENLKFYKKKLVVTSDSLFKQGSVDTTVINRTIIDGNLLTRGKDNRSVVFFSSAVDSYSVFRGFTLRGGKGTTMEIGGDLKTTGGGIFCDAGSTPTIAYNVITGNQVEDDGGGIFIYSSAPNIFHNIITGNTAVNGSGGGIECYGSIEVPASGSSSPDNWDGETGQKTPLENSGTDTEKQDSRLKMSEDDVKNSVNPRDATDVASAATPLSGAGSADNTPPIPRCENDPVYGDTVVGFTLYNPDDPSTFNNIRLDACSSYDPDSGDNITNWYWTPKVRIWPTKTGYEELPFYVSTKNYLCTQTTHYDFGGLLKFYLTVKDNHGLLSEVYDSVYLSVQYPPLADAGRDTIVRPGEVAYLYGRGIEINPDQRDSLKYAWRWVQLPPSTVTIKPSTTHKNIYFTPPVSWVYKLALNVRDAYDISDEDDEVIVVANHAPQAKVINVTSAFEGDTVYLDASGSYDIDSATFIDLDDTTAGAWLRFSWSVKSKPVGAENPVILDANKSVARFIPYKAGEYEFKVLVNDSMSVKQPPDSILNPAENDTLANIAFLKVTVNYTYAYPIIQGNLIYRNYSGLKGGGIDCNNSSPDVISNVFFKNQSKSSGGAICARKSSTPQIKSNVFFGNISNDSTGGAVADLKLRLAPSATRGFRKNMAIQYNDFWDNRGGVFYQASGNISNNIYSFPRFMDPDFDDFRFECSSPCFGAGDPLHSDIGSLKFFPECAAADTLRMVSFSLFQNPVATAVAQFIVNTDVPLRAPPVAYVTMGENAPSPVFFVPISSKSYRGSHVFTGSGDARISISAVSLLERDTTISDTISVQLIGTDNGGTLASTDGNLTLTFPQGSVKEKMYATCICVSKDSRYRFEGDLEMVALGEAYQLGPSIPFERELTVSFPIGHLDLEDKDKTLLYVYAYEDGRWNRLKSFLEGNTVYAETRSLGVFRLVYDPKTKQTTGIPKSYELFQNYPNPFNPNTQIKYDLPFSGRVELSIYNILGQRVKILVDEVQDAGHKSADWDGRDDGGREVASGIYFYKIKAENYQKTKKMVLLK